MVFDAILQAIAVAIQYESVMEWIDEMFAVGRENAGQAGRAYLYLPRQ